MWWNKYLDFQFEDSGRNKTSGDCWGLAYQIYKNELGIELPDYKGLYENTKSLKEISSLILKERSRWVSVEDPQEFDIIILNMMGHAMHIGIVTRNGYMIHCLKGQNTVHERYNSLKWGKKIAGFERYSGLHSPVTVQ